MVSNWEAVKEGLKLLVLLLTRDPPATVTSSSPSSKTVSETVNETDMHDTPKWTQTPQEGDECSLVSAIRFVTALGLNTLHRGIIQHIHDALLTLLDCFFTRASPSAFTNLIAELVAACFESSLPIIRRSGALPFILHSVLTVLHRHASPLLSPLVMQIVCWSEFTPLPPIPATAQSPEWHAYAAAFTQALTHEVAETDRSQHLVHTLNTITVCLSSPELATHFHPHLLTLLRLSLRLLDATELPFSSPFTIAGTSSPPLLNSLRWSFVASSAHVARAERASTPTVSVTWRSPSSSPHCLTRSSSCSRTPPWVNDADLPW